MKTRANGIPLMTCEAMGQMPCVKCRELFWPTAPFLCIEPPASFYFCEKCLEIIQPERSKRKDLSNEDAVL